MALVWTELRPAGNADKYWQPVAASASGAIIIVGANSGRLWLSTNGGANWAEQRPAGDADKAWSAAAMSADGEVILVSVASGRLYLTTDGGANWAETRPLGVDGNYSWYDVAVSADGGTLLAVANSYRVFSSTNQGGTWVQETPLGTVNRAWFCAVLDADGSVGMIAISSSTTDGDPFRSGDSLSTWALCSPTGGANRGWESLAISGDGATIIIGSASTSLNSGRLWLSTNGGGSWTEQRPAGDVDKLWRGAGISSDGEVVAASAYGARLWVSLDGGANWQEERPDGANADRNWARSGVSVTGSSIIAAVYGGRLWSATLGPTWSDLSLSINGAAASTDDNDVTLTVHAHADGAHPDSMAFSEDGSTWSAWHDYAGTYPWQLPAQADESPHTCTVYVKFKVTVEGTAYESEVASDTIALAVDWTAQQYVVTPWPTSTDPVATITFAALSSADDNGRPSTYRVREDAGAWSAPAAYSPSSGGTVTIQHGFAGTGVHTVEIELTDDDGNTHVLGSGPEGTVAFTYTDPGGGHLAPSLRVGSETLGWQEFGDEAAIGAMTRAMPGGDGSLDFSIPGPVAKLRRNVLVPGAEVVLDTGDDVWAGLVLGDPLAGYYSARDAVHVGAAGPMAFAARRRDVAWVWVDSDPTQWKRIRQKYDAGDPDGLVDFIDQGKFSVDTEGRLYIVGDEDRTFKGYSRATLAYWLLGGIVDDGCRIVGLDLEYKSYAPADWTIRSRGYVGTPWECATSGALEIDDGTTRSSWRTLNTDLSEPATSLILNLYFASSSSGSPSGDVFVKVRKVHVRCRYSSGVTVDRAVTIDNAMCDLATLDGLATLTRSETLGTGRDQLALRPDAERSVADGLRELAAMHAQELEYYFDRVRDPDAWRFTVNALPAEVNPQRNRHWILDSERPGEDPSGVDRDPEQTPEAVRITYLSNDVTGLPDGQPRSTCYPAEPADFSTAVQLFTDYAGAKLSDAEALAIAARVYSQRNAASFTGVATWPATAITADGFELPSRLIRPGDRVTIVGRVGAANLYLADTSYDWSSHTMSATVGWPFDLIPKPYVKKWRRRPRKPQLSSQGGRPPRPRGPGGQRPRPRR